MVTFLLGVDPPKMDKNSTTMPFVLIFSTKTYFNRIFDLKFENKQTMITPCTDFQLHRMKNKRKTFRNGLSEYIFQE